MVFLAVVLHSHLGHNGDAAVLLEKAFNILMLRANQYGQFESVDAVPESAPDEIEFMQLFLENLENGTVSEHHSSDETDDEDEKVDGITIDDGINDPHRLLLSSHFSARSLRSLVYDCCIWRARTAAAMGKNSLAQKFFSFSASIAAIHWGPRERTRNIAEALPEPPKPPTPATFSARGWITGAKRSWERSKSRSPPKREQYLT